MKLDTAGFEADSGAEISAIFADTKVLFLQKERVCTKKQSVLAHVFLNIECWPPNDERIILFIFCVPAMRRCGGFLPYFLPCGEGKRGLREISNGN